MPLAIFLSHGLGYGPSGVFTAIVVSQILAAIGAVWMFRKGTWKEVVV